MFVVTVEFVVRDGDVEAFREAMLRQARNSLALEEGCHVFDVCADPDDPRRTFLYEVYTDRAAFDVHLASGHFADFDATVAPWVVSKAVGTWEREEAGGPA